MDADAVHIVDNNSRDDTVDIIRKQFPQVKIVESNDNLGFARANNLILQKTRARYVLLLNPDAALHEGTLPRLIEYMEQNPRVGMVGCRLLQADGQLDHACKRSIPRPVDALRYFIGQRRAAVRYLAPEVGEFDIAEVDAINGAFMLVRAAALQEVGLLDETYWMYGEDLDWCARFSSSGWSVVYHGRVSATHLKGASSGRYRRTALNWEFHRSMAIFYRKHQAKSPFVDAAVYTGIALHFAYSVVVSAIVRGTRRWL